MTPLRIPDPFRTPGWRLAARIAAVLIFAAALLYALFSPPRFPLGDEYILAPVDAAMRNSVILEPGGRVLLGPSELRLWGRYPFVYGTETCAEGENHFILNMKDHSFRLFPASEKREDGKDEFEIFLVPKPAGRRDFVGYRVRAFLRCG